MRQEDKQVDGRELEREERLERGTDLVAENEEELGDGSHAAEREDRHTATVVGVMHTLLGHEHVVLDELAVSQRELRALGAVQTAVEGRDPQIAGFVYAEDRRALLEQALAVLQPDLASMQQVGGVPFQQLVHQVAELREQLTSLEDAQEEVESQGKQPAKGEAADKDDTDDDTDSDDKRAKASTLTGPERPEQPKPPSTLTGAERPEQPKPPTTLGDPKDIAEAARPPWWKRS